MSQAQVTKTTFKAESNAYKYIMTSACGLRHAVLRILVNKKLMDKFRNSAVGREVGHFVDILEQGGGWYEITDNDQYLALMTKKFGAASNGVKTWIRHFNLANLPAVKHDVVAAAPAAVHSPNPQADAVKPVPKKVVKPAPAPKQIQDFDPRLVNRLSTLAQRFGKTLTIA